MDRKNFVDFVLGILSSKSSFLPIVEIAKAGRNQSVLTALEAARLEGHGIMPDWLSQSLIDRWSPPGPATILPEVAISGHLHSVAAPIKLLASQLPTGFAELHGHSPSVKIFSGGQARVITQNFMRAVFTKDGFIPDLTVERSSWAWRFYADKTPTRLPGRTLLSVVEGSAVPSHWLFDTLPRFVLAKMFEPLEKFDQIMTAAKNAPFHRAAFLALGIDPSRVITRSEVGSVVDCDEFYAVTDVRSAFIADRWVYQAVVDCFPSQRAGGFSKRIYISREKATRRRILNEEQLKPILEKFGFQRVFAEDFSLFEMAGIMRDATHVVAPHGAGLSNVVFCNPGTKVMEIYNTHISTEFWKLCGSRELPYFVLRAHHMTGEAIGEEELLEMSFKERNGSDMILMPSNLESALEIFINT